MAWIDNPDLRKTVKREKDTKTEKMNNGSTYIEC